MGFCKKKIMYSIKMPKIKAKETLQSMSKLDLLKTFLLVVTFTLCFVAVATNEWVVFTYETNPTDDSTKDVVINGHANVLKHTCITIEGDDNTQVFKGNDAASFDHEYPHGVEVCADVNSLPSSPFLFGVTIVVSVLSILLAGLIVYKKIHHVGPLAISATVTLLGAIGMIFYGVFYARFKPHAFRFISFLETDTGGGTTGLNPSTTTEAPGYSFYLALSGVLSSLVLTGILATPALKQRFLR
jgi:hypothetical protein